MNEYINNPKKLSRAIQSVEYPLQSKVFKDNRFYSASQIELLKSIKNSSSLLYTGNCNLQLKKNSSNIVQCKFSNRNDIIRQIIACIKGWEIGELVEYKEKIKKCRENLESGDQKKIDSAINSMYIFFFGSIVKFDGGQTKDINNWLDVCNLFTKGIEMKEGDDNTDIDWKSRASEIGQIGSYVKGINKINRCMSKAEFDLIGTSDIPVYHKDGFKVMCFSLGPTPTVPVAEGYAYQIVCSVPGGDLYGYLQDKRCNNTGCETTFDSFMLKTAEKMIGIPPCYLEDFRITDKKKCEVK